MRPCMVLRRGLGMRPWPKLLVTVDPPPSVASATSRPEVGEPRMADDDPRRWGEFQVWYVSYSSMQGDWEESLLMCCWPLSLMMHYDEGCAKPAKYFGTTLQALVSLPVLEISSIALEQSSPIFLNMGCLYAFQIDARRGCICLLACFLTVLCGRPDPRLS